MAQGSAHKLMSHANKFDKKLKSVEGMMSLAYTLLFHFLEPEFKEFE